MSDIQKQIEEFGSIVSLQIGQAQKVNIDLMQNERDKLKREANRIQELKIHTKKQIKAAIENGIQKIKVKEENPGQHYHVAGSPGTVMLHKRISVDYLPD